MSGRVDRNISWIVSSNSGTKRARMSEPWKTPVTGSVRGVETMLLSRCGSFPAVTGVSWFDVEWRKSRMRRQSAHSILAALLQGAEIGRPGLFLVPPCASAVRVLHVIQPTHAASPVTRTNTARVLRNAELRQKTSSSADRAETIWVRIACLAPLTAALAGTSLMYANRSRSWARTLARSAAVGQSNA